jgi:large repetitive protein
MVAARNPSTKSSDPTPAERAWTVDTLAPAGAVQIKDGRTYAASRAVALALSADDPAPGSGVTLVSISNSGEDWSAWRSFSQWMDWTLSDVDGQKTVYVRYRDRAKNSTAAARDTITMDTKNPRGTVSINGGDTRTDSRTVTLSLSATDPDPSSGIGRMRFWSNGTDWSSWEPYESRVQRRLSAGAGKKTVYAQYRDRAGNSSERTKDSIYLSP